LRYKMALLDLPIELIQLIARPLSESDLAHLLQVHRSLYTILLPSLYQRHIKNAPLQKGIFWCAATGNEIGVKHFLDYGADVNITIGIYLIRHDKIPFEPWFDVQTPLSIAASTGNNALVALLLSRGAKVQRFPSIAWGKTQPPVVDALLSGHESTVRLLLMHGSPINDPDIKQGGLINYAISKGQVSLLKLLVEFGADLNIPWLGGYPLNKAISAHNISTEIVQFLLDNGADINLANSQPGLLLDQAIYGTINTLRLLLDRGIAYPPDRFEDWFVVWVDKCTVETVHLLLEHGYAQSIETLSIVVRARRGDILQLLIDSGMDLNRRDMRGSTLLHTAVYHCISSDPPTRRASRTLRCGRSSRQRLIREIEPVLQQLSPTCIGDMVEKDPMERNVRCLIRGGADLSALNAQGLTPLALAEKCPPVVQQMLVDGEGK
jgi:ankyrin repeat protein